MCLCMYVWLVLCKLTKGPSLFSDALHDIACYWQISLACHVHNIQSPTAHLFNTHTGKSWSNLGNVQITQMAISKQNGRLSVSSLACLLETFLGVYWWQTCQTTYFRDWIFQNVVSFFCLFVSIGQDAYDNLILRDTKKKNGQNGFLSSNRHSPLSCILQIWPRCESLCAKTNHSVDLWKPLAEVA